MQEGIQQVQVQGSPHSQGEGQGSGQGEGQGKPVPKEVAASGALPVAQRDELKVGVLVQAKPQKNVGGRPKAGDVEALNHAIAGTVTPERVAEMLERAIAYADYHKSSKALLAILEFTFDRLVGTPTPAEPAQADMLDLFMMRLRAYREEQKG